MASFFGEVTALSSRAVDDEEVENQPLYRLNFESEEAMDSMNLNCKLIIFSVGQIATAFVHSYFLPDEALHLSTVKYHNLCGNDDAMLHTGMKSNKQEGVTAAVIYLISPDVLICEVMCPIPEELSFDFCELLFNHIICAKALVLTTHPMATYKCEKYALPEKPFLNSLATSQYMINNSCYITRLIPPNFVTNVAAAVLAEFQVKRKPALCVVNFVDTDQMDSINVQIFEEVLKERIVADIGINSDAYSKLVKYMKAKQTIKSNLYI